MRHALVAAVILFMSGALWAQSGPRRDGNWEVRIDMQMPGMPMKLPPQTITQCVTPQEAADPQRALPPTGRGGRAPTDCKVTDQKFDGNKVTWAMSCPNEGMTGTGEFVYSDDSYTGTMKMNAMGQDMVMNYTAKRLGDCVK